MTEPSPSASSSSASNSSSARSTSSISSTGGPRAVVPDAAQDRPLDQELLAEQVGLGEPLVLRLGEPDREQLALVVPVVERLARGEPLVALQPHQRGVERLGQHLRGGGLADAGLALEQQRQPEPRVRKTRGRHALVGEVAVLVEPAPDLPAEADAVHRAHSSAASRAW